MKKGKMRNGRFPCGERECSVIGLDESRKRRKTPSACEICCRNCKHKELSQGPVVVLAEFCEHCKKIIRVLDKWAISTQPRQPF